VPPFQRQSSKNVFFGVMLAFILSAGTPYAFAHKPVPCITTVQSIPDFVIPPQPPVGPIVQSYLEYVVRKAMGVRDHKSTFERNADLLLMLHIEPLLEAQLPKMRGLKGWFYRFVQINPILDRYQDEAVVYGSLINYYTNDEVQTFRKNLTGDRFEQYWSSYLASQLPGDMYFQDRLSNAALREIGSEEIAHLSRIHRKIFIQMRRDLLGAIPEGQETWADELIMRHVREGVALRIARGGILRFNLPKDAPEEARLLLEDQPLEN